MTPLPFPLYLASGVVAALFALAAFAAWAQRGGVWRFVLGVLCGALAWDALRVLQWRSVESYLPVHASVPLLLVGALCVVRAVRYWRALGSSPESEGRPEETSRSVPSAREGEMTETAEAA